MLQHLPTFFLDLRRRDVELSFLLDYSTKSGIIWIEAQKVQCRSRCNQHLPPAHGATPPYATESTAHCGFYYTACSSFCTGGKWERMRPFAALFMDENP